ncbi:hypothetical protein GWO43_31260 [candidate division KSB1 bacterium]|nr:hypothetical protein [candidate division KSB1 bacterium]NIR73056.1 hypothetical protein [candidate division KSB1 bacterium]NIS28379.1 hypothetical protein [candidate division KSB1 bacterium]NIT75260.1 hypothetical protein [candidate division KSB1 bacterium]NIU24476.1 hypothetical protein [candidate division KSB1 bacterium]
MDATGSLAFFMEHHTGWTPKFLPAAIVFGGGVPRDMHRISQLFGTYPENESLEQCLERLANEDVSACREMILLNANLADEGKQFWLDLLEQTRFATKQQVEQILKEIQSHDFQTFEAINPCSGDTAKAQFHRIRTLLRGLAVKGHIYHQVRQKQIPESLKTWPQKTEIENFISNLKPDEAVTNWLEQLEDLRDAIYELSRNPLMVWENLKQKQKA